MRKICLFSEFPKARSYRLIGRHTLGPRFMPPASDLKSLMKRRPVFARVHHEKDLPVLGVSESAKLSAHWKTYARPAIHAARFRSQIADEETPSFRASSS